MSEENQVEEIVEPTELDLLRERAKTMGIPVTNKSTVDSLKKKIQEKLEPVGEQKPTELTNLRQEVYNEAMRLVRVRIQSLDPADREVPGTTVSIGNDIIGNFTKYIPFGDHDDGYHIPHFVYLHLKSATFTNRRTFKDPVTRRMRNVESEAVKYAIEVLPQLTEKELKALAAAQKAAEIGE